MLNALRAGLRTGRVTGRYPERPEAAPDAFRGRPRLDPLRCDGDAACAAVCPAECIAVRPDRSGTGGVWELDLARCVFCGLCQDICPSGSIVLTGEFELAARRREDLVVRTRYGASGAPTPDAPAEQIAAVEAAPAHLDARIRRLLRRSLHIRHMDAGSDNSTDWELNALLGPTYDLQRLGIDVVASPRHADLLFVTGAVTRHLEPALRATYKAMPEPRLVVAAGSEACGGGVLAGSYAVRGGVDACLPVDVSTFPAIRPGLRRSSRGCWWRWIAWSRTCKRARPTPREPRGAAAGLSRLPGATLRRALGPRPSRVAGTSAWAGPRGCPTLGAGIDPGPGSRRSSRPG